MAQGMIQKLIDTLMGVVESMHLRCEPADVEKTAVMVHRVMSYQARQFHTLDHVFGFLDGADGITTLAAVFHDLIYYQVDDGLPSEVASLLDAYVECRGSEFLLRTDVPAEDPIFLLCSGVFGYKPGDRLRLLGGLNEYLSALVMAALLHAHLDPKDIAATAACIEASIPFRSPDAEGLDVGQSLERRLRALATSGRLDADEGAIHAMVHRAIDFGNRDVQDFALDDPGGFLANTWKLLPESNASLRSKGTFSVREYRRALQKMLGFFRSLDPDSIAHSYRGSPDEATMRRLSETTRRNLGYAQTYMRAKLLAVALVESVAELSGGDAPMALFMGDVPHDGSEYEGLMEYLPQLPAPPWLDTGNAVYRLLRDGRLDESSFDLKNSPLALYLYHRLKPSNWGAQSRASEAYFEGRLDALGFLHGFETGFLTDFLRALAAMVPTRRAALAALSPRIAPSS